MMDISSNYLLIICAVLYPHKGESIALRNSIQCSDDTFRCDGYKCIPRRWLCDGSPDCNDHTDEQNSNCPSGWKVRPTVCENSQFRCDNGFCIPIKWKCDGNDDCGDASDEPENVCSNDCADDEFRCGDDQCIAKRWKCDGHPDCTDASDEEHCHLHVVMNETSTDMLTCADGFKIPLRWKCDGIPDCLDGADEKECDSHSIRRTLSKDGCRRNEFRCPEAFCILGSWICDGRDDCPNGEDEENCPHKNSSCEAKNEFKCLDGSGCVKFSVQCDGLAHCLDASDELDCPNNGNGFNSSKLSSSSEVINEVNLTMHRNCDIDSHFECSNGHCISNEQLCDGKIDCSDRQDESIEHCGVNECSRNNGGCEHLCNDTRDAHFCSCFTGYKIIGKYNCIDVDECSEIPGICSQQCTNTVGGYRCSCSHGYLRDPASLNRCKAATGEVFLIFSHSYDIRSLRLRDRDMTPIIKDTRSAIALDYHFKEGKILWSDRKDKKIYRTSLDDPTDREILAANEDVSADGLAVDWLHANIYYTDAVKSAVYLLSWDASRRKTLVEEDLGHPRAIVVEPHKGFLYWTDWGTDAKIERSGLDGSSREAIVTEPHLVWPNGLTIDISTNRIFWCDGRMRTISSANMDGTDVKVVLYSSQFLRQPFSISVFEDRLYWTDWSKVALFSANKFTGANIQNVSAGHLLESPKVVHVYHEYRQPSGENVCDGHSCSHFCVKNLAGAAVCACADQFILNRDEKTCRTEGTLERNVKELVDEVKNLKVIKTTFDHLQTRSHLGLILGATFILICLTSIAFAVFVTITRRRNAPIGRVRFHNPVYRKTTTTSDHCSDAECDQPVKKFFTRPLRHSAIKLSTPIYLNENDDASLTRNNQDEFES